MALKLSPVDMNSRKELDMKVGDTVRVHQKIQEKGKTRVQVFEGLIIARKHGSEQGGTFTVRRATGGYGVEKIFPIYSPMIDDINIVRRSKVRKAKLYHIRKKAAKEMNKRMKMEMVDIGMARIKAVNKNLEEGAIASEEAKEAEVKSE